MTDSETPPKILLDAMTTLTELSLSKHILVVGSYLLQLRNRVNMSTIDFLAECFYIMKDIEDRAIKMKSAQLSDLEEILQQRELTSKKSKWSISS